MKSTLPPTTERFSSLINRPGGSTLAEAVKAADSNLQQIRESALAEIEETLSQMQSMGAQLRAAPTASLFDELYARSNTIVGVAGVFGLGHVGAVAYSLCELIDRFRSGSRFNPEAVQVHLDSLRLMQGARSEDVAQAEAVRRALQLVVNRTILSDTQRADERLSSRPAEPTPST